MSVFSNKNNYGVGAAQISLISIAQDKYDEVHIDVLGSILTSNSRLILREKKKEKP